MYVVQFAISCNHLQLDLVKMPANLFLLIQGLLEIGSI